MGREPESALAGAAPCTQPSVLKRGSLAAKAAKGGELVRALAGAVAAHGVAPERSHQPVFHPGQHLVA